MKWIFSIIILIGLLGCWDSEKTTEEIEVIDKNIAIGQGINCTMIGKVTSCRPKPVTKYYIYSLDQQFNTSLDLYNEVEVGKKYTMLVSENRYIFEILKE